MPKEKSPAKGDIDGRLLRLRRIIEENREAGMTLQAVLQDYLSGDDGETSSAEQHR